MLIRREEIDDALHGLLRIDGVQGREHQMAGLGRVDGGAHRLDIAHFTDEDDVGRFTHGVSQRRFEVAGVDADLALVDHAAIVNVAVFNRILDGDDVPRRGVIHVFDHRRERRRFS